MLGAETPVRYAREPDPRTQVPKPLAPTAVGAMAPPAKADSDPAYAAMWSWLDASRRVIDLWRESVRQQQDAMIRLWRPHRRPDTDAKP